ncbi:UNVERIFIED_CONTAM: hypothetical protein RMT77_019709 [Armadillidium vulgare]
MTRKFPNIEYNLPRNIIRYDKEPESLKNHSLNLYIGKIFKDIFKSKWALRQMSRYKFYQQILKIEKLVSNQLKTEIGYLNIDLSLRKSKVHFMTRQILNYIKKYPYPHIEHPEILFPDVIFTNQGTINTMKTLFMFGNANSTKLFQFFQLTCHLFFEDYFKPVFQYLPFGVKKNMVSEMKNDYFINFCIREAQIDHPLIRKAFDGYPHDNNSVNYKDSFFKAIKTNNEIAVEYLWRNKISKMIEGRAILGQALILAADNALKTNILMFLLFQVNENEFEDFFRSFSFKVIENVIKEVRWHCVFDKIFDSLKIYFNCDFVLKIFDILSEPHCKDCPAGQNLDLVVNFFSSLSEPYKIYIVRKSTPNHKKTLSSSTRKEEIPYERVLLKSLNRKDYLEKLLKVEDCSALKDFFISKPGGHILTEAVRKRMLDCISVVLKNIFSGNVFNEMLEHWQLFNIPGYRL